LEVGIRNSKCVKDNLPEKNKPDSYAKRGDDSDEALASLLLMRGICREPHKYRDKAHWVDRNKDWDKGDKKISGSL